MSQKYSITFVNGGKQPWQFYVYQQGPKPQDISGFSLAWLVTETVVRVGDRVRMTWSIDYNFVWGETGILKPGIIFSAGGIKSCSPSGANMTRFNALPVPRLSEPSPEKPMGTLIIHDDKDVTPNKFSVGIGMSNAGTLVTQAGPSLLHHFTSTPTYYVAAGEDIKSGTVLDIQTITRTAEAKFGPNVYDIQATLDEDDKWTFKNL